MPKATFFNLPEEKRQAITRVAIEEFAGWDYNEVSISRMVEKAGIAKGSFYQYFEDKKDLFFYLVDLSAQQKMAMLAGAQPPDPATGLFATLRFIIEAGLAFQFQQPGLNEVAYRALYGSLPFRDETLQRLKDAAAGYYRQLIELGIATGEVDPQIDRETAAFVLSAVFNDLGNFFLRRVGADPRRILERRFDEGEREVLNETLEEVMTILRRGLGRG